MSAHAKPKISRSKPQGLIVGAGVAGIATALFGAQYGFKLDIYERDKEQVHSDHLLWLAPNGLRVLDRLGLVDKVLALSVPQEVMGFTDRRLKLLLGLQAESLKQNCTYPIVAIKRCDLMEILYQEMARKGLSIHWGHELTDVRVHSTSKLTVTIGANVHELDFLVGADGIGSKVRSYVAPESRVTYQGIRTWLGRSDHVPIAHRHVGKTMEVWGTGTRFVLTSLDGDTIYWSALERAPIYESNSTPVPTDTLERLERMFADYHFDVRTTLKYGNKASLVRCNFGVVGGVQTPFKDNIILVGDAAHGMPPNMGQGASLGLEDGLWTAYGLATAGGNLMAHMAGIAAKRAERIKPILKMANSMNHMFQPQSIWGSVVRDSLAKLMPDAVAQKQIEGLYQPSFPPSLSSSNEVGGMQ